MSKYNMTIQEALDKLFNAVELDSGVSPDIKDFLIALTRKHEVDLSGFFRLDRYNMGACLVLLDGMKSDFIYLIQNSIKEKFGL